MKKFLKELDKNFERYLATALMVWIVGWTFFQVLSRYFLKSIYWAGTEEMARYSFIWMVMLGATMLTLDNDHLKVDILKGVVGDRKAIYIDIVWEIVTAIMCAYLLPYAWKIFYASFTVGRAYPSSGMPMAIFQFNLVFLCAVMIIRNIEVAIRQCITLKTTKKEVSD